MSPLVWIAVVMAFAAWRPLFDDEWFSLELAQQADTQHFWHAVASDLHPPWVPLLDRAISALTKEPWALRVPRLAAAVASICLLAPVLRVHAKAQPWLLWLSALHPIVGMYVGAVRWYPFLMLAQALRAWAICARDQTPRRRAGSFAAGAALGALTVYVDPVLTCAEFVGWTLRAQRTDASKEWRVVCRGGLAALVGIGLCLLAAASCTGLPLTDTLPTLSLRAPATWGALGMLGEALPGQPWYWLGLLYMGAALAGLWWTMREPSAAQLRGYLLSSAAGWLLATQLGVWHPRYSLLLCWILSVCALAGQVRIARFALLPTLAYMAAVWAAMVSGQGFFKADLNRLQTEECPALGSGSRDLLCVVPYAGLASELETRCTPACAIIRLPSVRIVASGDTQLEALRKALQHHPRDVALLSVDSRSSLRTTDQRVRDTLHAHGCRPGTSEFFGAVPYPELRRMLRMQPGRGHYVAEQWHCPTGPSR